MTIRSFDLSLMECTRIHSEQDVISTVDAVASLGLFPGVGSWTVASSPKPVMDIAAFLPTVHRVWEQPRSAKRTSQVRTVENWGFGLVWPEMPGGRGQFTISRRGVADWDVSVLLSLWSYEATRTTLPVFAEVCAGLLSRIGMLLYERAAPAMSILYDFDADEDVDLPSMTVRRRMVVGWRTWYGPAYVEAFGRDTLLGLPDRAEPLDDGGVFHALDAPPLALVQGDRNMYAGVFDYLRARGIEPAWPKPPKAPRARRTSSAQSRRTGSAQSRRTGVDDDREQIEFNEYMRTLLDTILVLADGRRIVMLPIAWPTLSEAQRVIAIRHTLYAIESLLQRHPDGTVQVEFDEIPPDLRGLLDRAVGGNPRVTVGLLSDPPG